MPVGADEAGKGPVLGPMVAAAVRADPAVLPENLADSKTLAPARRDELDAALRARDGIRVGVAVVPVDRIDDPATDMNRLGVAAQAEAVCRVAAAGDRVIADAADTSEERFASRLREAVAGGVREINGGIREDEGVEVAVTAEHGADETYPLVSAASVVAKVERDRRVGALAESYGRDVGSGYPGDETTRAFLREYVAEHGCLPDCARASWQTSADVLAAAEQAALDQF